MYCWGEAFLSVHPLLLLMRGILAYEVRDSLGASAASSRCVSNEEG